MHVYCRVAAPQPCQPTRSVNPPDAPARNIIVITAQQLRRFHARRNSKEHANHARRSSKATPGSPNKRMRAHAKRKRGSQHCEAESAARPPRGVRDAAATRASRARPLRPRRQRRRQPQVCAQTSRQRGSGTTASPSPTLATTMREPGLPAELDAPACEVASCASVSDTGEQGTASADDRGDLKRSKPVCTPASSLWHHVGHYFTVNDGRARFRKALFRLGLSQLLGPPVVRQQRTRRSRADSSAHIAQLLAASAAHHDDGQPGNGVPDLGTMVSRGRDALARATATTTGAASATCRQRVCMEPLHGAPPCVETPPLAASASSWQGNSSDVAGLACLQAVHADVLRWLATRVARLDAQLPGRVQLAAAAKRRALQREIEETYSAHIAARVRTTNVRAPTLRELVCS